MTDVVDFMRSLSFWIEMRVSRSKPNSPQNSGGEAFCFSYTSLQRGVLKQQSTGNRLNGFRSSAKPLVTWLKPGENERIYVFWGKAIQTTSDRVHGGQRIDHRPLQYSLLKSVWTIQRHPLKIRTGAIRNSNDFSNLSQSRDGKLLPLNSSL
jgi:hypothetical protein